MAEAARIGINLENRENDQFTDESLTNPYQMQQYRKSPIHENADHEQLVYLEKSLKGSIRLNEAAQNFERCIELKQQLERVQERLFDYQIQDLMK